MEIAEFLLARIAEEKAAALVVKQHHGGRKWTSVVDRYGEGWVSYDDGYPLLVTMEAVGESARILVEHVAAWNPDRVLADCEAKRLIVELHKWYDGSVHDGPCCAVCAEGDIDGELYGPWPCDTLRALAAPYVDHPDCDEAWKPDGARSRVQ